MNFVIMIQNPQSRKWRMETRKRFATRETAEFEQMKRAESEDRAGYIANERRVIEVLSESLKGEIANRLSSGARHVSVAQMGKEFLALGYRLDRSMDCRSVARIMTGPRAGETYPCCSTSLTEISSGLGYAHYQAGRGANFRRMMELRNEIFAVSHGAILEV